ncbi:MAG: hypothetical protein ISN29_06205 [Gammaproteobacteria bacterium AqS3]|nr:hypothetical protein [Gammaproteobacteria bacterium AqS3]
MRVASCMAATSALALASLLSLPLSAQEDGHDNKFYWGAFGGQSLDGGEFCGQSRRLVSSIVSSVQLSSARPAGIASSSNSVAFTPGANNPDNRDLNQAQGVTPIGSYTLDMQGHSFRTDISDNGVLKGWAVVDVNASAGVGISAVESGSVQCEERGSPLAGLFMGVRMGPLWAFEVSGTSEVESEALDAPLSFSTSVDGGASGRSTIYSGSGSANVTARPAATTDNAVVRYFDAGSTTVRHSVRVTGTSTSQSSTAISLVRNWKRGPNWGLFARFGLNFWKGSTTHTVAVTNTLDTSRLGARDANGNLIPQAYFGDRDNGGEALSANTERGGVNRVQSKTQPAGTLNDRWNMHPEHVDRVSAVVNRQTHEHLCTAAGGTFSTTSGVCSGTATVQDVAKLKGVLPWAPDEEVDGSQEGTQTYAGGDTASGVDAVLGVGVEWQANKNMGVRGEYVQYRADVPYAIEGVFVSFVWKF